MKRNYTINGREVTLYACSAICPQSGKRQPAIFVHDSGDTFGNGDCLAFDIIPGYLPETDDDAREFLENDCAYAVSDWEALESIA